jgi:transitional endoplasmic reticulum ATPase
LEEGDVLEILGKRRTAAVVLRLPFQDRGLDDLLRLDGLQRQNAGVSIGDHARVGRATVVPAAHVVLAWAKATPRPPGWAEALRRRLLNRPLVANDLVATDALRLSGDGGSTPPPTEQPALALPQVRLRVVSTVPTGVVRVVDSTGIELTTAPEAIQAGRCHSGVTYDDVGGLGDAVRQVRELIDG